MSAVYYAITCIHVTNIAMTTIMVIYASTSIVLNHCFTRMSIVPTGVTSPTTSSNEPNTVDDFDMDMFSYVESVKPHATGQ